MGRGDVIVEVNQLPVNTVSEFKKAIAKGRKKNMAVIYVKRQESARYLTLNTQNAKD